VLNAAVKSGNEKQLNRRDVARAVWNRFPRLSRHAPQVLMTVPRVLPTIGMYFTDSWWKQVRELCLVRYGCDQDALEGELRLLARLPDVIFRRIVAFVVPPAFQLPRDYHKLWCEC
jgi:hypothetical protein